MEIPLTVFIFEFIQVNFSEEKCNFGKQKVGDNEGLLSWSGNTRFSGGSIDGVKKKYGEIC